MEAVGLEPEDGVDAAVHLLAAPPFITTSSDEQCAGAVAGSPFGLRISDINTNSQVHLLQNGNYSCPGGRPAPGCQVENPTTNPAATFAGKPVIPAFVNAEFVHPYTNIFGATANWFEGNYTNTVFRMEQAYQLGAPFQPSNLNDRVQITAEPA